MIKTMNVAGPDGQFQAYVVKPETSSAPCVLVLHEVFGVNNDMRQTCDELAAHGFIAVCPNLFWRQERGELRHARHTQGGQPVHKRDPSADKRHHAAHERRHAVDNRLNAAHSAHIAADKTLLVVLEAHRDGAMRTRDASNAPSDATKRFSGAHNLVLARCIVRFARPD
jgi:hypothetical protein